MKSIIDYVPAIVIAVVMAIANELFDVSDWTLIVASTLATGFYYIRARKHGSISIKRHSALVENQ